MDDSRVTVDLRKHVNFKASHVRPRFKWLVVLFFASLFLIISGIFYESFKISRIYAEVAALESSSEQFSSQAEGLREKEANLSQTIESANRLIKWQMNTIHSQKILSHLLADLPKEVLLDRFVFRRSKSEGQASISLDIKGSTLSINEQFEKIPKKLQDIGLDVISIDQSEIRDGMNLNCLCQFKQIGGLV